MFDAIKRDKKLILRVVIATFLFGFAAYSYRYFNSLFSHDSLMLYQNDFSWQISLGRFLQPVYCILIRSMICSPLLIGLFSLTWLSAANYLLVKLLSVTSNTAIIMICGVMTANFTLALSNASFLPWVDIYTLSLLFSVIGCLLCSRSKYGFLFASILFCLSLGLYQSYIQFASALYLIMIAKRLIRGENVKDVLIFGIKALCSLLIGLLLYGVLSHTAMLAFGVEAAQSYNGISGVLDYGGVSLPQLIIDAYIYPFASMTWHNMLSGQIPIGIMNAAVLVLVAICALVILCKRRLKRANLLMLILTVLLMPFGFNIVYVMSKGLMHNLMTFSFNLLYVGTIIVVEELGAIASQDRADLLASVETSDAMPPMPAPKKPRYAFLLPMTYTLIGAIVLNSIIVSNQLFLKKDVEYHATLSVMTRILDRMEQTDGYILGETPVVIIGKLDDSAVSYDRPGFEVITEYTGMRENFAATYYTSYSHYFNEILGYPLALVDYEDTIPYIELPEVKAMPAFPQKGCCMMLDGVMIVKLSDPGMGL